MQATNIVRGLLERGLLDERPERNGGRGQPQRVLCVRGDAGYAVGVSFSHSCLEIGLVRFDGLLEHREVLPLGGAGVDELGKTIQSWIAQTRQSRRIAARRIWGVGISLPGDYRVDRKIINAHYFPQFADIDLQEAFSERLDLPAVVENDSACAAWGEHLVGAGRAIASMLFLFIGHGVGGGMTIGHNLIRGHHGNAGVFGMAFPLDQPRPSGSDLLNCLRQSGHQTQDFRQLAEIPVEDPVVSGWLDRAAQQLIEPLGVLARAFDPEAIVIGGRLPVAYLQALTGLLDTEAFCLLNRHELPVPRLVASTLGQSAGIVGGGSLVLDGIAAL